MKRADAGVRCEVCELHLLRLTRVEKTTDALHECDLRIERQAHPVLRKAIADCETAADYVSRELFTDILESEEGHIDWLETQLSLIERVGIENYCQSQMRQDSQS